MKATIPYTTIHDDESINYDDIPEITDFSKAGRNPHAGRFIKNGKFNFNKIR